MANKITLKDRKKAQPKAIAYFSDTEKETIKNTIAKDLNQSQFSVFMYTAQALGLNPLLNEIAAVTYKNRDGGHDMSIQVMRDGFLTIAHRSGKFAGLESGVNTDENGKLISGWAKVYHKDFTVPVYQEADFSEYDTGRNLWTSKPKTMIKKVAESMALRKAFNISGVYAPEEMDKEINVTPKEQIPDIVDDQTSATDNQRQALNAMGIEYDPETITKGQAAQLIREQANKKK